MAAAVVLSAGLNGYAAVLESGAESAAGQAAAATISGLVPGLVWGLGQLSGWLVRAGMRRVALAAGAVGVGLLLLSLWHCAHAVSALTGLPSVMGLMLAVGIDCGLVVAELAAILVHECEE